MSQSPTISVLTTVYNRSKFIGECIESVQNSKFQDYEHIIVDDRSSDDSVEIAEEYALNDPRIQVHVNDINLGDYPNRNKAASLAKGKYIKYLDADDMLGRWMLDIMVDVMETHPECALGLINYTDDTFHTARPLAPAEAYEAYYSGKMDIFNRSPLGAIIRKDTFDSLGGFSGQRMIGDFEMWHIISRSHPIVAIPYALSFYRRHGDSETATWHSNPIWPLHYTKLSIDQLNDESCPLPKAEKEAALRRFERIAARSILLSLKNHGPSKTKEMRTMMEWSWTSTIRRAFASTP